MAAGAKVVVADLAADKGRALADELPSAEFVETDVTSEESVGQALERAAAMGPIRVAVSVHGGFGGGGRTVKADGTPHSLDDFRRVLDHYLVGTFNVLRLSAAAMSTSKPTKTSGPAAWSSTPPRSPPTRPPSARSPDAAAKGGVVGMTLATARDLAVAGVRVLTIAPGTFITPAYGSDPAAVEAYSGPCRSPSAWGSPTSTPASCSPSSTTTT